jgi:starvation-inducible DNA-binding protein
MARSLTAPPRASRAAPRTPSESRSTAVRLFATKNDLPEANRRELTALLNQRLADAIDLQTQCKQAHWNVKGPSFIALHYIFDVINEEFDE